MVAAAKNGRVSAVAVTARGPDPNNDGAATIAMSEPYIVTARIQGTADLLFHRWNVEAIAEKAGAAKGSKAKKTDNIESYVYRDSANHLCLPGEYVRQAIIAAAKFRQDPRSPRKSAADLYKAGVVCLTPLASLGIEKWDYEDSRRVMVQRNGVTRVRPALKSGWTAEIELLCNLPEYIDKQSLHEVLANAGRLCGVGDFRPTYGRFLVTKFE